MDGSELTNEDIVSFLCNETFFDDEEEDDSHSNAEESEKDSVKLSDISTDETPKLASLEEFFLANPFDSIGSVGDSSSGSENVTIFTQETVRIPRMDDKKKKKKKIRIASDIRETYADKILKAINEAEFAPLLALLNGICTPSASLYVNRESKRPHSDASLYSTCFKGPVNIAKYYYGIMTMEPDAVIELKSSKFHPDSPTGLIVIKLEYRATKMYNLETTYSSIASTVEGVPGNSNENMDLSKLVEQIHDIRDQLPMRKKSVKVFTKGLIRVYTNQDKRITQILMDLNLVENNFSVENR